MDSIYESLTELEKTGLTLRDFGDGANLLI